MNIVKKIKNRKILIKGSGWLLYKKMKKTQKMLPSADFELEFKKYLQCIKKDNRRDLVNVQMRTFLMSEFELISDRLVLSDDKTDPIIISVVRNELERMKIFFQHYRTLGVKQFVILDNGSDDGTLEYLSQQENTRVYRVLDSFQTQKKESWIEKLLAMTGFDRWYMVIDSDELLDYVGSEEHSVTEFIRKCEQKGLKRVLGFMLDMYSKDPLFSNNKSEGGLIDGLKYFDKNGYILNIAGEPGAKKLLDEIYGGPRHRMFGMDMTLSKQAIFFYEKESLYRSCHYMYPLKKWGEVPCLFVLRHYKFLPDDRKEFERRVLAKNFYNGSVEYRKIMEQISENNELGLYCDDSKEYENSNSLKELKYLDEIDWNC